MRKNNGITLIALVVTIIVLLILAGIALSLISGSDGILDQAEKAAEASYNASIQEDIELALGTLKSQYYEARYVNGESVGTFADYAKTQMTSGYTTSKGATMTVSGDTVTYTVDDGETISGTFDEDTGEILVEGAVTPPTTVGTIAAGTYTPGQEVTYKDEQFFVIADDGNSVRLLAKYCLNQAGTEQTDKSATNVTCGRQFSQTNYWSTRFTSSPYDLQSSTEISAAKNDGTTIQNAVLTAKAYGKAKDTTGRLMTYQEAEAIQNGTNSTMKNILWGNWNDGTQPTQGYLDWYLGDAIFDNSVWAVTGHSNDFSPSGYNDNTTGVRPVLVVSESKI